MMAQTVALAILLSAVAIGQTGVQGLPLDDRAPLTATLSNQVPLVFGMDMPEASAALRQPLQYVSGPPGQEIYLALRNRVAAD